MNTYFEIRFFRVDGYCFAVNEFGASDKPSEIFADKVRTAKELIAKARAFDLEEKAIQAFIPHQIQLVERDDAMTWLTEHDNWVAA